MAGPRPDVFHGCAGGTRPLLSIDPATRFQSGSWSTTDSPVDSHTTGPPGASKAREITFMSFYHNVLRDS